MAPFPIAITDQQLRHSPHPGLGHRQRPDDLLHEQRVRMRCRPENLHTAGRQIDDEHRVVRHGALPRPNFGGEEIRSGDRAPMRAEKRLPRCRALRNRRQARRLQDPLNRRAAHAVADVLVRALDPRVPPRRIFLGPCAQRGAESRGGRRAAPAGSRPSISAQSAADASAATCQASRSWRCPARPHGPLGAPAPPAVGDRRR